ncbi:MAG: GDSL-type esterase/lipase family protein [Proteobacteria bacterium]|nr:GDSL-type esterase/lipase family protein [Pseudomonadota bacterium]
MKKILLETLSTMQVSLLLLIFTSLSYAQTARVLIIGDSWAQLQLDNNHHNQVFIDNGYANITIDTASDSVSENGKMAADWAMPNELQIILDIITTQPDIDTVQLTIGGNDFLNAWNINMTMLEEQALQQQIHNDLTTIVNAILALDSNIEIVLSFYDYPNFEDTIGGLFGTVCNNLNNDMGQPSTTELNTAATTFEEVYSQIASNNPRVYHVSHFGLMQSFFGFPGENILPGDILPPGVISRPSPVEAMRDFGATRDCFHLTADGYRFLVQNIFDGYFQARFDTIFKTSFE